MISSSYQFYVLISESTTRQQTLFAVEFFGTCIGQKFLFWDMVGMP